MMCSRRPGRSHKTANTFTDTWTPTWNNTQLMNQPSFRHTCIHVDSLARSSTHKDAAFICETLQRQTTHVFEWSPAVAIPSFGMTRKLHCNMFIQTHTHKLHDTSQTSSASGDHKHELMKCDQAWAIALLWKTKRNATHKQLENN
jgi:hypothetical protein